MDAQDFRSLQEAYIGVYDDDIREKLEFESWVNSLIEEGYDLSDYTWEEMYENYIQLDEAIRNLESRKKLRAIMDREVVKGDKSKGQNPRMKYHTKKGDQALGLIIQRDETGSKGNPVRSRGGMADSVGPTRDRGAGNKAARRAGKSVPNTRDVDESYDLYDIILSHLIDEGYADTYESAERIMVNMSEEWRESIVETRMDPRGRPASGPMNVYANPKGKPSQARLDAIKSYEDEQRKKTPEQRKKELDDYRERQMNNK